MRARNGVGAVAAGQGDHKAALEHLNAALATAKERLASRHPEIARSYQQIGNVYVSTGQSVEGLELLGQALALQRAAGGEPAEVPEILLRMALAHSYLGEDDRALVLLEEAEALQRKVNRVQPRLAHILIGKGVCALGTR